MKYYIKHIYTKKRYKVSRFCIDMIDAETMGIIDIITGEIKERWCVR